MGKVAVFHFIGRKPSQDKFIHTIEQIWNYTGEITFDGAYDTILTHRAILRQRQPILFIQGNTVGTPGVCTWDEIFDLQKNYNFRLGWHGWSHRKLTALTAEEMRREVKSPFATRIYAYPHGEFNGDSIRIIQEAKYNFAYSTTQGEEGNDFAIPREYI